MAIKNQAITVTFLAWDTANSVGKTGDAANITMYVKLDEGAAAAVAASVAEIDATNMPGMYSVALTADEANGNFVTVAGKSTTADVVVYPVTIATERGNLATVDALVDAIKAVTDALPNSGALTDLVAAVTAILVDTAAIQPTVAANLDAAVSTRLALTSTVDTKTLQDVLERVLAVFSGKGALADGVYTFYKQDGTTAKLTWTFSGGERTVG